METVHNGLKPAQLQPDLATLDRFCYFDKNRIMPRSWQRGGCGPVIRPASVWSKGGQRGAKRGIITLRVSVHGVVRATSLYRYYAGRLLRLPGPYWGCPGQSTRSRQSTEITENNRELPEFGWKRHCKSFFIDSDCCLSAFFSSSADRIHGLGMFLAENMVFHKNASSSTFWTCVFFVRVQLLFSQVFCKKAREQGRSRTCLFMLMLMPFFFLDPKIVCARGHMAKLHLNVGFFFNVELIVMLINTRLCLQNIAKNLVISSFH